MMPDDEWYYSELLDLLNQKEREKEESYYRQIEFELPLVKLPTPNGDEKIDDEPKNRGVIIIDLLTLH